MCTSIVGALCFYLIKTFEPKTKYVQTVYTIWCSSKMSVLKLCEDVHLRSLDLVRELSLVWLLSNSLLAPFSSCSILIIHFGKVFCAIKDNQDMRNNNRRCSVVVSTLVRQTRDLGSIPGGGDTICVA